MRQIYTLRVFALLIVGMLSVALAMSQPIYSVQPPAKLKASQPYFSFAVSIPLTKVFKPIRAIFSRKALPISQSKPWEADLLSPLHLQQIIYPPMFDDWSPTDPGICSTCDNEGYYVPCNGCGGDGGSVGGGGTFPAQSSGSKHRIPGFSNMETQTPGNCVPSIIAKVLTTLCNKPTTWDQVLLKYFQMYPDAFSDASAFSNGVNIDRVGNLIEQYLNAFHLEKPQFQLLGVLQGNTPIMVGFRVPGSNFGHNMLITGWKDNGNTLIILDPETGSEKYMPYYEVLASALYLAPVECK